MASVDIDDRFVDPDELKVPENPRHRRVIELVGALAGNALRPEHTVYRDMNWYPRDGGTAVAPDVMVLPADVLATGAKSYKPADDSNPIPSVVVEVPSDTDGWGPFWAKANRYRRLGVVLYIINIDHDPQDTVMRLAPDDPVQEPWTGRPIPELGNIVVDLDGDTVVVRSPDGSQFASTEELAAERDALAAELKALRGPRD